MHWDWRCCPFRCVEHGPFAGFWVGRREEREQRLEKCLKGTLCVGLWQGNWAKQLCGFPRPGGRTCSKPDNTFRDVSALSSRSSWIVTFAEPSESSVGSSPFVLWDGHSRWQPAVKPGWKVWKEQTPTMLTHTFPPTRPFPLSSLFFLLLTCNVLVLFSLSPCPPHCLSMYSLYPDFTHSALFEGIGETTLNLECSKEVWFFYSEKL